MNLQNTRHDNPRSNNPAVPRHGSSRSQLLCRTDLFVVRRIGGSIIDTFLGQGGGEGRTSSSLATTTSTVVGFDAASTGTAASNNNSQDNNTQRAQSVCATSFANAQTKLCSGSNLITCQDVSQCPKGEACFSNVVCESPAAAEDGSAGENSGESMFESDETWVGEISHFVMMGTDQGGETMMFMSEPLPENFGGSSGGFSSSSSSSLTSGVSSEGSSDSSMSESVPSAFQSEITMADTVSTSNTTLEASSTSGTTIATQVEQTFTTIANTIDNNLFLYETPLSEWIPSTVYRFDGFFSGLQVMHSVGVAGKKIFMGANSPEDDFNGNGEFVDAENCEWCFMYGLVNIAAFLAQAMKVGYLSLHVMYSCAKELLNPQDTFCMI